jgi:transposase InsO family protein
MAQRRLAQWFNLPPQSTQAGQSPTGGRLSSHFAVVVDRFPRAILGWQVSTSLHADMVTAAIQKALRHGDIRQGAFFQSDRGCQYTASQKFSPSPSKTPPLP